MPSADDFRRTLAKYFHEGEQAGQEDIVLTAGEVHRRVGGYPGGSHSMPTCCSSMRKLMQSEDELLYAPPSGKGASLKVRYHLPRTCSSQGKTAEPRIKIATQPQHNGPDSDSRFETTIGKVVCFIPCCKAKTPSGTVLVKKDHSSYFSRSINHKLIEARKQGNFAFDSDGPETTALELYTGSPYKTFAPIKHELYQALNSGDLRLYIISAGYGVLDAREPIHNYNEEMKGQTAQYWKDYGLQNLITEILIAEKPNKFYGFFAAKSKWSQPSSRYRYFFTEGGKRAISIGLDVTQAGCFYRLDGNGVAAILGGLGRTFVDQFKVGFNPEYAKDIERNYRRDGNVTIGFDRFR